MTPPGKDRPRTVHVIGSLAFGGIETWLMHVLRNQQGSPVRHEFLLAGDRVGEYESEVRSLGIPIHRLRFDRDPLSWFLKARHFFGRERPTVVHSHCSAHFTAVALAAARTAGIPVRIAHSHEARHIGSDQTLGQRLRRAASRPVIRWASTRRIGISEVAAEESVGAGWRRDSLTSILLYGFDFSANDGAPERGRALRRKLKISEKSIVIGHVGRFSPVKNHDLLLRSFAEFASNVPDAVLVMVGTGELQPQIEKLAHELGISGRIRFAGLSDDIPAYMAMFELFVFPSFSEGLGIVCLEAQAAGTRCLVSTGVPPEVIIIQEGVSVLSVEAGPKSWAKEIERLLLLPRPDRHLWRQKVEESAFGIRRCVSDLNAIYASELARHHIGTAASG
jgi:glycosyltransferase involved in cell wall biosynthesis